jgi:hypothetical protein
MGGIYDFDEVDEALTFMPTAARRALDVAGLKLSLQAWQAMERKERELLVQAGACDVVDPSEVALLLACANPPPERVEPIPDPDPSHAPADIGEIDPRRWVAIRPLDRYALVKAVRKPEKLARVRDEIIGNATPIPSSKD